MGFKVGAIKPIETGVTALPPDGAALYEKIKDQFQILTLNDVVPITYPIPAAPYIASKTSPIAYDQIDAAIEKIEAACDILLIEGAGGILVPLDSENTILDLVKRYNATLLLVTHCKLGCINDTLVNLTLLQQENIPHCWAVNCQEKDLKSYEEISLPYFKEKFSTVYHVDSQIESLAQALLDTIPKVNQD